MTNHILARRLTQGTAYYYNTLCGLELSTKSLRKPRNGKLCANCSKIMRRQHNDQSHTT